MNCACASQSATLEKFRKIFQDLPDKNKMVAKSGGAGHTWWGRRGTPYNSLYGEALPERGTFFRLQVYERVGISPVEIYERVGKSVIWVCERAQRAEQMHFKAL